MLFLRGSADLDWEFYVSFGIEGHHIKLGYKPYFFFPGYLEMKLVPIKK